MCEKRHLQLLLQAALQSPLDSVKVFLGNNPALTVFTAAGKSQILGHDTINIDSVDASLFKGFSKGHNLGGVVELAALGQTTGPGEDRGDGVGAGLAALLVLAVVAGDGAVGSLGLERLAVGGNEDGGHETKRTEALGDDVGLYVAIVVCRY